MNEALRDWVTNVQRHLLHHRHGGRSRTPIRRMVRDFQSVIGREAREQMLATEGRLPDTLVACIGGGSNAIGLFHPFLDDKGVAIYGVEAGGHGLDVPNGHGASMNGGRPACCTAIAPIFCRTTTARSSKATRSRPASTIPASGPEHSWLKDSGRVNYVAVTDKEALAAFQLCTRLEGIIPALEPAHALAYVDQARADAAARTTCWS